MSRSRTRRLFALAALAGAVGLPALPSAQAQEPPNMVTVTPLDLGVTWFPADTRPPGTGIFESGPATPPLGVGSFELRTPDDAAKAQLFTTGYNGVPVSQLQGLGYSTFRDPGATGFPAGVASLNVAVNGGPSGFHTFVFEPYLDQGNAAVLTGVWQTWDAYRGGNAVWWTTRPTGTTCDQANPCTWNALLAAYPGESVVGVGFNQGTGNAGFHSNVDNLSVNQAGVTTTFDFEPDIRSLPGVVTLSTTWSLRESLTTGPPTIGPFQFGTRPPALVPLTGDWDGDGVKTPGIFQVGVFKLSNTIAADPNPPATFTFGNPRGFPVSGDFDGNRIDDVAVYFNGAWEIRYLGPGAPEDYYVHFGSGTWPNVVPVAGDWDGIGHDGIGYHCRVTLPGCPAGTWNLRNTAGVVPVGSTFVYNPGAPGAYPVVGDWDGNGTDTVGVRSGTTWLLRNSNTPGGPDVPAFDFGGPNDLPVVWAGVPVLQVSAELD